RGDYNSHVKIELSTNGGDSYDSVVAEDVENNGSFAWNVPALTTTEAKLRISETGREAPTAVSGQTFVITHAPTSAVTAIVGRAARADGIGIPNVRITLTPANGAPLHAVSNGFGYFSFQGVPAGETAVLAASHRLHTFAPRILVADDELGTIEIFPT